MKNLDEEFDGSESMSFEIPKDSYMEAQLTVIEIYRKKILDYRGREGQELALMLWTSKRDQHEEGCYAERFRKIWDLTKGGTDPKLTAQDLYKLVVCSYKKYLEGIEKLLEP